MTPDIASGGKRSHNLHNSLLALAIVASSVGFLVGRQLLVRLNSRQTIKGTSERVEARDGRLQMADDNTSKDGLSVGALIGNGGLQRKPTLIGEQAENGHVVEIDYGRRCGTLKFDPLLFGRFAHNFCSVSGLTTPDVARPVARRSFRAPDVALSQGAR